MTPLRRKKPDLGTAGVRDAFRRVAAEIDAAQRTLLAAVPTARDPGIPLGEALEGFLAGLARAAGAMPAWRSPRTEPQWQRCDDALASATREAERLRADPIAERLEFEPLNARLGELVAPLEEFADAAAELRRMR